VNDNVEANESTSNYGTIQDDEVTELWGERIHMTYGHKEKFCMEFYGEQLHNDPVVIAAFKKEAAKRDVKYFDGKCPPNYTIDNN
jgi:hypothetical protein